MLFMIVVLRMDGLGLLGIAGSLYCAFCGLGERSYQAGSVSRLEAWLMREWDLEEIGSFDLIAVS